MSFFKFLLNFLVKKVVLMIVFFIFVSFISKSNENNKSLEKFQLNCIRSKVDFSYDSEYICIELLKPKVYKLFYSDKNTINIFLPLYNIENFEESFSHSFYNVNFQIYDSLYSVIKIYTLYPIPFNLIKTEVGEGDHQKITFSFPLQYHLNSVVYFYTPENSLISTLKYNLIVRNFPPINITSYLMEINQPQFFEMKFIEYDNKKELTYRDQNFWFAVNGTYFAKNNDKYFTVAGVVENGKIVSYPVEYRPKRGFFALLKNDQNQYSFMFDRLVNKKREFEEFVQNLRQKYLSVFLIQAGPLIYKDYLLVMDPDNEGLGKSGNNIVEPAPRTVIYTDKNETIKVETIYGIGLKRKEGLSLYELASYLEGAKDALNLDGGSSSCMYIAGRKIEPMWEKSINYKSQNYLVFSTNSNFYHISLNNFYYYFPGIFGYGDLYDNMFGSKVVTFFDGYQKYQKVIFNENIEYYVDETEKIIFIQTNDIDLALEKLGNYKIRKKINYHNCYLLFYE